MSEENPIQTAKEGVSLVGEIIKAAGDNPQVKEAAGNLGQTAVTLTKTINNALLPLAAINFAFDKARVYFAEKFQEDLSAKAATIPLEHITEPKASIAGPTLQGLAFTHEEPDLKEMYLNLLATAMDNRVSSNAHPAFVEIIKQLDSEDAKLILHVLQSSSTIAIVQILKTTKKTHSYNVLLTHLLDLREPSTEEAKENTKLPAMIDNLVRLGLVEVSYDTYIDQPESYSWVEQRPEFLRLSKSHDSDEHKVEFLKGILHKTDFGEQFAQAVGLK